MNDTEQHRRECEARYVMQMTDTHRQAYYQGVFDKRGKDAANELIDEVNRMRKIERGNG